MLKSTFKKVSAIAIAGTMLAGMMAVPANAMSNETVYTPKNVTVLNETFNNYTAGDYKFTSDNVSDPTIFSENSNIQYTRVSPPGWSDAFLSIVEETDSDNYLKIPYDPGFHVNFDNPNGSTSVNLGDKVEVSFKALYTKKEYKAHFNFNDAATRFTMISSTDTRDATAGNSDWASSEKGRFFTINSGHGRLTVSDNWDNGRNFGNTVDTWFDVTATINTRDADHENKQTLTLESGGWKMVGYFDANYTGEEDTEYTPISSIDSLQVTRHGEMYGGGYLYLDDLKVSVSGTESHNELVSDLSKTLVDENFSNLTGGWTKSNGWTLDNKQNLVGTVAKYATYAGSGTGAAGYPDTTSEKALKITGGNDHAAALYMNADETLTAGDIVNMSFDYYQTNQNAMFVSLQGLNDKGVAHKDISSTSWYGSSMGADKGDGWRGPMWGPYAATADKAAIMASTGAGASGYDPFTTFNPVYGHNGGNEAQNTFIPGKWYTIELSINTKNEEHGNKQTLSLKYKERGAATYTQEYLSYFDADATTIGDDKIDALSVFNGFDIGVTLVNPTTSDAVYIDNVKAEIVKPGFEVVGVENSTNTWTFGNDDITLNYVVDASADSKVIIAQYAEGGRMISAATEDVDATGRDTVTVTPETNANTIKVMVLDMSNALPYTKAFVMTRQ